MTATYLHDLGDQTLSHNTCYIHLLYYETGSLWKLNETLKVKYAKMIILSVCSLGTMHALILA